MQLQTPIAFCVFNRPRQTERVFRAIARAKPRRLLVFGDGPREGVPSDGPNVESVRRIVDRIDWKCELQANFSHVNLGCRNRMASGLNWAFQQAEELIVLEDDCLPHPSFFGFCESLLAKYRHDPRVMMISGDNFQTCSRTKDSYYFSWYPHIWGWASWRRAWNKYDVNMPCWPAHITNFEFAKSFPSPQEFEFWSKVLQRQYTNNVDTWDYAWAYAIWKQQGLTILPDRNLVTNIGFDEHATHTLDSESPQANLPVHEIGELLHPEKVTRHIEADQWTFENIFAPQFSDQRAARTQSASWFARLAGSLRNWRRAG